MVSPFGCPTRNLPGDRGYLNPRLETWAIGRFCGLRTAVRRGKKNAEADGESDLLAKLGGPYRDRTDDIHGVNVALYQLS
jgi:hypothetical protein